MTTYLVTGAAGFIGSNYIHWLTEREPTATIVALDYGGEAANWPNLDPVADQIAVEMVDVADLASMEAVYRQHRPEYVVNFAAESHNDRAILDATPFMHSNAVGAQVMAECSRRYPVAAHVHVSTIEVYGELGPEASAFAEGSPLQAKTPYAAAKAAGDQIVRAYMQTYPDMPLRLTHCSNNYGPYQLPEKLIPLAITTALRGNPVPVYGDGKQRRDWLHVRDHCEGLHRVLHADLAPTPAEAATDPALLPIFDISAGTERTNLDIVRGVLTALELDPNTWIRHVPDRPNHDRRYRIDPRKITTELDWAPQYDLDTGLAETVRWYREHRRWWEQILAAKGDLQIHWEAQTSTTSL